MNRVRAVLLVSMVVATSVANGTVLERTLSLEIGHDVVIEREELVVALTSAEDVARWRSYRIEMDDHIELDECVVRVLAADGREIATVPPSSFLSEESVGFGLYTSRWQRVVPLGLVQQGQRLAIRVVRTARMPYPSMQVALTLPAPQEQVRLEVVSEPDLHWRVVGDSDLFATERSVDDGQRERLIVRSLQPVPSGARGAVQLGWHPEPSWAAVAKWYAGLVDDVPRTEAVDRLARDTCAGSATPRECLERLARLVSRHVRYEAVSIGPGGWIPSPPEEVLRRHWGDCKDKSMLLVALLEAVEIPGFLALANVGERRQVDPAFPSPQQFNHCIVAVPVSAVSVTPGDPVEGGFLLYDPTVEHGGIEWLNPQVQGRRVLVVGGSGGLLRLGYQTDADGWYVRVTGNVAADGALRGRLTVTLVGRSAVGWLDRIAQTPEAQQKVAVREALSQHVPIRARLTSSGWRAPVGSVPTAELTADLELAGCLRLDRKGVRWVSVNAARLLLQRWDKASRWPAHYSAQWQLQLTHVGCSPRPRRHRLTTGAGRLTAEATGGTSGELRLEASVQLGGDEPEVDSLDTRRLRLELLRAARERTVLQCGADRDGAQGST
jgi:transglutaminase-like putative cysteine protease